MTSANNQTIDDASGSVILARLDVQDEELGVPVREFLASFGCIIYVNENTPSNPEYHIIYGDVEFVKGILSNKSVETKKRLMVLSGQSAASAENFSRQYSGKTALVGLRPLSSREISQLFAFFFTSHKKLEIFEETKEPEKETRFNKTSKPSHNEDTEPMVKNDEIKREIIHEKLLRTFEDDDRERIANSISNIFGVQKTKILKGKHDNSINVNATSRTRQSLKISFIIFLCFMAPTMWYLTTAFIAGGFLILGEKQLRSGEYEKTGSTAVSVHQWADRAGSALNIVALPFRLVGFGEWFRGQERMMSFFHRLADAEQSGAVLVGSSKVAASAMVAPLGMISVSGSPAIATDQIKEELLSLSGSLGLAQSELSQLLADGTWPFVLSPIKLKAQSVIGQLARSRLLTQQVGSLFTLYPDIAGFKEKKTYLLLLQNSMELRPTGGFIGSVATVSMEDGRITEFTIHDVYALDGQLKGHVDPPAPIAELLHQEHWYLRDSNWDPDFSESAARAAWFYEKESGNSVNGVVGINVSLLMNLLRAVGSIDLADYNDRITADNFFAKSIYYTQSNFFPGSTQKKDFLGALSTALLTKISGSKKLDSSLLRVGIDALRKGDVLLWFANTQSQAVVDRLGWAGKIKTKGLCIGEGSNCLPDRTLWVEGNLSVNKVNYFIRRTIRHHVVFSEDGSASVSMAVTLTNTSPSDDPKSGGGTYRLYGRLIVPPDVVVDSVTIDGVAVSEKNSKKKGPVEPPYLVNENGGDSRILGIALDVPRGQHRQVVISYRRQIPMAFLENRGVYDLYLQKQPGILNTDVIVDVTFPIFWQPQGAVKGKLSFLANQTRLEYNTTLKENEQFTIRFQK